MVHRNAFIVFVVLNEIMLLAPLLSFAGPLQKAKHLWQRRYGTRGGSLVRRFDERWLDASSEQSADLLEHPDPSALADYSAVYGAVKGMRLVPFGRSALIAVALAAAVPMIPLLLVVIPLPKLLGQLAKALL